MNTERQTIKRLGIVLSVIALLGGCVGTPMTVTTLTDRQIDYSRGRTVLASACGFQLLLFIPIGTNERAERAFQQLRQEAGENSYIVDLKVRERWTYAFIGTVYCTDLEATAYPTRASTRGQPVTEHLQAGADSGEAKP